jgi:hypothetical protein
MAKSLVFVRIKLGTTHALAMLAGLEQIVELNTGLVTRFSPTRATSFMLLAHMTDPVSSRALATLATPRQIQDRTVSTLMSVVLPQEILA